jgi:RHS repeat-associated protein
VSTYAFDADGRLTGATLGDGRVVRFLLDPAGNRFGKSVDDVLSERRIYGQDLEVLAELNAGAEVTARYVYVDRTSAPAYVIRDGRTYRIVSDKLGSVRIVVDVETGEIAQRLDYDAWGEILVDSAPGFQPFGYGGREWDPETGFYYLRARYYDPRIGRFVSPDPIGFVGRDTNLYAYVVNAPADFTDSSGLLVDGGFLAGVAARTAARTAAGWGVAVVEPSPVGEIVMGLVTVGLGLYEIYDATKGERSWEKGRGDDPYWEKSEDELRDIENDPKSTAKEKERARRIRKQKKKKDQHGKC